MRNGLALLDSRRPTNARHLSFVRPSCVSWHFLSLKSWSHSRTHAGYSSCRTPRCVSATRQDTLAGAQGRAGQRRPPHAAPCLTQRPPRLRRRSAHCARARCRSHASSGRRRSAHCAPLPALSNSCVPSCVRGKPAPRTTRPALPSPGCPGPSIQRSAEEYGPGAARCSRSRAATAGRTTTGQRKAQCRHVPALARTQRAPGSSVAFEPAGLPVTAPAGWCAG